MARNTKYKPEEADFEEVIITCANCSKKMKAIKVRGLDMSGMLCQTCGKGDTRPDTG